jgi:hypothetical protein
MIDADSTVKTAARGFYIGDLADQLAWDRPIRTWARERTGLFGL